MHDDSTSHCPLVFAKHRQWQKGANFTIVIDFSLTFIKFGKIEIVLFIKAKQLNTSLGNDVMLSSPLPLQLFNLIVEEVLFDLIDD